MRKAIRDHLRDFLAILGLFAVGLLATYIIVQNQRLRIPLLEEKPFELKADMSTAQAVTPGQGQTVRVAGVRVGDISAVDYENGHAVVTMAIDRKFLPVYKNATILLRPKTGLKDMFLELDPGTNYDPNSNNDEFQNGDTIPVANTAPDTNVDQILSALDGDTRAYLRLLLVGGGQGLNGRGKDLGKLLGSLGPINRGLARLNTEVAKRKENLATLIHNMNLLWGRVGEDGQGIEQLVSASNQALGAIASQSPDVERTVHCSGRRCGRPGWPSAKTDKLADVLGPTINSLRPFARKLKPVNDSLGNLAKTTHRPGEDRHPAVRRQRPPARARPAAGGPEPGRRHPAADHRRGEAQQALQHGRLQPERRRGPGHPGPRRGLPLLAGLARPRRQQHLLLAGRARRLPPRLPDGDLQHGQGDPRQQPARARGHGLRPAARDGVPAMTRTNGEAI